MRNNLRKVLILSSLVIFALILSGCENGRITKEEIQKVPGFEDVETIDDFRNKVSDMLPKDKGQEIIDIEKIEGLTDNKDDGNISDMLPEDDGEPIIDSKDLIENKNDFAVEPEVAEEIVEELKVFLELTSEGGKIYLNVWNNTSDRYEHGNVGLAYLQVKQEDGWHNVMSSGDWAVTMEMHTLSPGGHNKGGYSFDRYGNIPDGEYRLVFNVFRTVSDSYQKFFATTVFNMYNGKPLGIVDNKVVY